MRGRTNNSPVYGECRGTKAQLACLLVSYRPLAPSSVTRPGAVAFTFIKRGLVRSPHGWR